MMREEKIKDITLMYLMTKFRDLGHKELPLQIIKNKQSYVIGHKRKSGDGKKEYLEEACKIVHVKSRDVWKLYWKRADMKWHLHSTADYEALDDLLDEIRKDPEGCFWG